MKKPLISCLVPVYNGERYLGEALDSILAQTYRPLEIIVVDDGSTDGSARVVANYDRQVRALWQSNAGPWAARNLGLRAAKSEFVAFLDADDVWHPEKLKRQMVRFQARPELYLCVTHIQNFWIPALMDEAERFRDHRISQPLPAYTCPTLLARRSLFDKVGPFDVTIRHATATEWILRATRQWAVVELLPDVLTFRRLHLTNRSRVLASTSRDEYLQLVKDTLDQRRSPKEKS